MNVSIQFTVMLTVYLGYNFGVISKDFQLSKLFIANNISCMVPDKF